MTAKQMRQFNQMRSALTRIAKLYQSPAQMRRNSEREYGLGAGEAIEMAYENVLAEAKQAIRGVRAISAPSAGEKP